LFRLSRGNVAIHREEAGGKWGPSKTKLREALWQDVRWMEMLKLESNDRLSL
jgi:hypothetical protein